MNSGLDAYRDLIHPEYLISRSRELPRHIARLIEDFSLPANDIREVIQIGPGLGNETAVLRDVFPQAQLTAIDQDPMALDNARAAADQVIDSDAMNWLANLPRPQLHSTRIVIALRTSPEITQRLLQIPLTGDIRIASLVGPKQAEDDLVDTLRRQHVPVVTLEERRGFYDFAFRLS